MKYVCMVLLCLCVIAFGRLCGAKYQNQIKRCEAFLIFLSFAKSELSFSQCTVLEMVHKYWQLHPRELPFLESLSEPVSAAVKPQIEEDRVLSDRQKALINGFFEGFGMQDVCASEQFVTQYMDLFRTESEQIRLDNKKKIKLTNRLSLLLAAAVVILFI